MEKAILLALAILVLWALNRFTGGAADEKKPRDEFQPRDRKGRFTFKDDP